MTLPDGRQVNTSPKFDIGRNFCNKLWNASRFTMMNLEGMDPAGFDKSKLMLEDRWILSRLAATIAEVTDSLEAFKFSEPVTTLYRFFWNDFCDWYLEWAKSRMQDEQQKPITQNILAFVLDGTLRLLHPLIPFITEGIFQKLNEIASVGTLGGMVEPSEAAAITIGRWPARIDALADADAERQVELLQGVIRTIREIRNNRNIPPKERLVVSARAQAEIASILNGNAELIRQLAGADQFDADESMAKPSNAAVGLAETTEVYVHDAVDIEAELEKLNKQKLQLEKNKAGVEAKLANEDFVNKAKPQVVAQAREKLAELTEQLNAIEKHLLELTD